MWVWEGPAGGDGEPSGGTVGAFRGAERQHLLIAQARAVMRTPSGPQGQFFPSSISPTVTLAGGTPAQRGNYENPQRPLRHRQQAQLLTGPP